MKTESSADISEQASLFAEFIKNGKDADLIEIILNLLIFSITVLSH